MAGVISSAMEIDDAVHPDLWARFAKLEQKCNVHFARIGEPRRWSVVIGHDGEEIRTEDVALARALTAALMAAESKGWS
jgi:hypothetical protein